MAKTLFYPNSIDELKDGDVYQVIIPFLRTWSEEKIYNSNICNSKKKNLEHLIEDNHLIIIKND